MKLDVKAFSLTCGIVAAIGLLVLNGWIRVFESPSGAPLFLTHIYRGYSLTLGGSLIGAAWAFADGIVCGAVFAWLYDLIDGHVFAEHRVIG